MIKNMKKNCKVLRELILLRFHGLMVFRLDFFGPFFVDGSLFLIQLVAFGAVYANVDQIGGWRIGEMILYIGTFSLINAVSMTICFFGLNGIPGKVQSGELDLYLTKPVSPLFRLTFENISPGSIPLVLMSICIIAYGAGHLQVEVTGRAVGAYLFWVALMEILYYEMEVIIRSVSLYIISTARIAFYGVYKVIFYLLLPYGIMATLPVQSLIGEMDLGLAIYGILVALLFSFLTGVIWKKGLRRYHSASS